jgi:hypothetical protein
MPELYLKLVLFNLIFKSYFSKKSSGRFLFRLFSFFEIRRSQLSRLEDAKSDTYLA